MNPATALIGPLMVPECKRSARRGWGLVIRCLAGLAMAIPSMLGLWWWWVGQSLDADYQPQHVVPLTLIILECMALGIVLVLTPAILAGSLAGERERGSIGLLLSTSVDAREIVMGRMFGLLSVVLAMIMAGLPFLLLFAVLGGLSLAATLCLILLPISVAFGIGGVSMAASAVARRGRNALILLYVFEAMLLLAPSLALAIFAGTLPPSALASVAILNPFLAGSFLVMERSLIPAIASLGFWIAVGGIGVVVASMRLRPSFLALVGGKFQAGARRHGAPPVDENRPMLWKELYIERIGALGWFGRLLGILLMLYLVVGTVVMAGLVLWASQTRSDAEQYDRYLRMMSTLFEGPAFFVSIIIQIAVGLRAAVTISSEREQGTWDALLTSPLTGREILWGKLWGSLYSLRYFLVALLFSWGITTLLGAMDVSTLVTSIGMTILISAYAAAVGVRASLSSATATRAMSVTVGVWLATGLALMILAGLALLLFMLVCLLSWMVARPLGLVDLNSRPWMPTYLFGTLWIGGIAVSYLALTDFVVLSARTRFDQIAGRLRGDDSDRPPSPRYDVEAKKAVVRDAAIAQPH